MTTRLTHLLVTAGERVRRFNLARRRHGWVSPIRITTPTARLFVFLFMTLVGLGALMGAAIRYVGPVSDGRQITLRQFLDLSGTGAVRWAVFHDFDHRVTGAYIPARITVPPAEAGQSAAPASPNAAATHTAAASGSASSGSASGSATSAQSSGVAATSNGTVTGPGGSTVVGGGGTAAPQEVTFWTTYPSSDAVTALLIDRLTHSSTEFSFDHQTNKGIVYFLSQYMLPLLILANLFALIFLITRSGGEALSSVVQFGRIGRRRAGRAGSRVTFGDVGGADEVVAELREVRDYLTDPTRFAAMGAQAPKGVLLFGPPGCGKTLLARAVAGEANVPFFSISGAEFVESLVGVGAARVRDLFRQVRAVAPAIVFIDELDAAGRKRGGVTGGQEEREQTLNQLLVEMDGFDPTQGIVVMGATNRPDILDPALMRPGRFDRQVTVEPPDLRGRMEILELHARGRPVCLDVDFEALARRCPGFTGADLANVVNEAALLTVRFGRPEIGMEELEEAVLRVLAGPQRRGRLLSEEERRRAAYHEGGHALVAAAVGNLDELQRVSIVSRGRSLGQTTASKRWQERSLLTRSELRDELVVTLGGVAAEELVLGEPSTGAADDLMRATDLAHVMVGMYGMSERLGKLSVVRTDGNEFLGANAVPAELASGPALSELHQEVRHFLDEADSTAQDILRAHRQVLDELADRLLLGETLEGAELEEILDPVRPEANLVVEAPQLPSRNGSTLDAVVASAE